MVSKVVCYIIINNKYMYSYFLTTDSKLSNFLRHSEHSELCQLLRVIMFIKVELR